jgi:Zn-dependent protease with chaperone function
MIEAATAEDEVVGVMAHELAHVLLRHGTAQATKAQNFQLGAIAGAIAGAIIGGDAGAIISEGSRFGLGTYFLKYSREYEKQADILGAQLMAAAGYDPMGLATMFETISRQGGSGGPEWMSSHPNPGNRSTYIRQEAAQLRVSNPVGNSSQFARVKSRLQGMSPAPSSAEATRRTSSGENTGVLSERVEAPSSQFRRVRGGDIFEAAVPANWQEYSSNSVVKYAPEGGYGRLGQQVVFTHGVEFGLARNGSRDLRAATDNLLNAFAQGNPQLRIAGQPQQWRVSGRQAITTVLSNVSDATGRGESVTVTTALLNDATLFYCLTVAPQNAADQYGATFNRILRSLSLKQ